MSRPTLGIVIATPGRNSIFRTINSIQYQGLEPGDDVLIVGDGFHQPTQDLVRLLGPPFRYVATTKTRDWGHSQVNYGLKHVKGDWLLLQDDDDVFAPRAFDEARQIISKLESPRPVMGRVMTPYLGILWREPNTDPVDGHCLLVPNDKRKLGYVGLDYAGDQKWIITNLKNYPTASWADRIWSLTRPKWTLWPKLYKEHAADQVWWTFHRDQWDAPQVVLLKMNRWLDQYWSAKILLQGENLTLDEVEEVVQFAAWAAQGLDVYVDNEHNSELISKAAARSGFKPHQEGFTKAWPPHSFEPVEET